MEILNVLNMSPAEDLIIIILLLIAIVVGVGLGFYFYFKAINKFAYSLGVKLRERKESRNE